MQEFDVYRKWLGIPPEEQPPHHYRLLGVGLFETDADVIANAADRQMAHVRTFQAGRHSALSQKLLNELAAARITLLDPKRRAVYDQALRAQLATTESDVASDATPPPFVDPTTSDDDSDPLGLSRPSFSPAIAGYAAARRKKKSRQGPMVAAGVALVTLLLLVWLVFSGTYEKFLPVSEKHTPKTAESRAGALPGNAKANPALKQGASPFLAPNDKGVSSVNQSPGPAGTPAARPNGPKLTQKPLPPAKTPVLRSKDEVSPAEGSSRMMVPAGEPSDMALPEDPEAKESKPHDVLGRLPVPDEESQKKAEETIRTALFQHDFEAAERSGKHEALAKKLLDEGLTTADDPPATYVFLKLAGTEAAAGGDIETAFAAIDALAQRFEPAPIALRVSVVELLAKTAKLAAAQRVLLATRMLETTSDAVDADEYDLADRALAQARQLSAKARDPALIKEVANRGKQVQAGKQAYEKISQARKTLETTPDDAAAKEIVGQYYCFNKGDWTRGLKFLAAADNPVIKELAQRDLASPRDNEQRLSLADGWWELAEKYEGAVRQHIRQRAGYWYKRVAGLSGLRQSKVRHRLAEIADGDDEENSVGAEAATKTMGLECRSLATRPTLLKRFGGNERTELAVDRALTWLDKHQNLDGSWNFNHHGPRCKDLCPNPGSLEATPNAATAVALLAFLGNGSSTKEGRYRKNVAAGLAYLKKRSTVVNGAAVLYEPKAMRMPSHALATVALCEAAAMSRDKHLHIASQALVNFIVASQAFDGGWSERFPIGQRNGDMAMSSGPSTMLATVWNLTALRTAQWAGATVPRVSLQQASRFLERARSYAPEAIERTMGAYGRFVIDWSPEHEAKPGTEVEWRPLLEGKWLQNYFQAVCLKQTADPAWEVWNRAMRDHLLETQAKEGHASGSWYSDGGDWCDREGGRLFCTVLGALILENYYRYPTAQ